MMRVVRVYLSLLAVVFCSSLAGDQKYTMKDLEALAQQEAWKEMVEHLADIPPSQRDKTWQGLLEKAATGYLSAASEEGKSPQDVSQNLLRSFPTLKKSAAFMQVREGSGIAGFEKCYAESYEKQDCTEKLVSFLKTNPNPELALKAGELVARYQNPGAAMQAFRFALTEKTKGTACKNERLQNAIITALGHPKGEDLESAKEAADKHCFNEVRAAMEKAMDKDSNGYIVTNVCSVLKRKGTLKGLREKRCRKV